MSRDIDNIASSSSFDNPQTSETDRMSSLLRSILTNRCPGCRTGRLFLEKNPYRWRTMQDMPNACETCGQDFVIEPGFFFGSTYVSYALNVAWLIPTFLVARFVLGFEYSAFLIGMCGLLPLLVPLIFRVSRSIWIHMFVKYDPGSGSKKSRT